jgi:hypothetical protein
MVFAYSRAGQRRFETNRFKSSALPFKGKVCLRNHWQESVMHRNIGKAAVAFVLFLGASGLALAAETAAPSTKGVGGDPTAPGIGNTSSTHNPNPNPASRQTGMENRGSAETMGTDTSTHNPTGKKD